MDGRCLHTIVCKNCKACRRRITIILAINMRQLAINFRLKSVRRTMSARLALLAAFGFLAAAPCLTGPTWASSHREAPLISNDPLADNTDLYAFRSPDDPTTVTIIANYIPFELPEGGPNYSTFGTNIHYEVHVKNNVASTGDDITYRFTFSQTNEDPTTFFNIRLGKQNLKTTYVCEKSTDNGGTWTTIITGGIVPPANIGPRSIDSPYGLNSPYSTLMANAISTATGGGGEKIFCGPIDDPFFVDLAGIFDLGGFNKHGRDGLAGFNCHTIALKIPIASLQKDHHDVSMASNILDGNYVIGVWASASRMKIRTLNGDGTMTESGGFVQVSRLGMPLTNEAIIPIGMKDKWNASNPYSPTEVSDYAAYFANPELSLYTGGANYSPYGFAIPGLAALKIDSASLKYAFPSLGGFDFRYGHDGLYPLRASNAGAGTALDTATFGKILMQKGLPRSCDLLPIFYTGVPNLAPYQLVTGKNGNPLAPGKPLVNNFLPVLGDMLRLNMATPVTSRTSADFNSLGLVAAAELGILDPRFSTDISLQAIPNMDGFPNGRRLEDDVTTIELLAVGGGVLNAIGLWTDDYNGTGSPVTPQLIAKLGWTAGVTHNDVPFDSTFPFVAAPHRGSLGLMSDTSTIVSATLGVTNLPNSIGIHTPAGGFTGQSYPNPARDASQFNFHVSAVAPTAISIMDERGQLISTIFNQRCVPGDYSSVWTLPSSLTTGTYFAVLYVDGQMVSTQKFVVDHR